MGTTGGLAHRILDRGWPHGPVHRGDQAGTVFDTAQPPALVAGLPPSVAISRQVLADILAEAVAEAGIVV